LRLAFFAFSPSAAFGFGGRPNLGGWKFLSASAGICHTLKSPRDRLPALYFAAATAQLCLEGIIYREATGQEEGDCGSYGDPSSNAESMALRRAAAKFGLALYLYDK
jgi:hypothetical protein